MHDSLLSLIIPHYNHKASLPRLLDSILAQTLKALEVIIVDDCSDENQCCVEIVAAYKEKGLDVRLIQNEERHYTKDCRLIGVEASKGEVIGFADADDMLWGTEALEYHTRMLIEEDADIIHFAAMQSSAEAAEPILHERFFPLAERLYNDEIFAGYANADYWPSTHWNKLCRRRLWDLIMPQAKKGQNLLYSEDMYLTSLLFFHAQRYIGSNLPGYHYLFAARWRHKRPGRLATNFYIQRELIPYFFRHAGREKSVTVYAARIQERLNAQMKKYVAPFDQTTREALQSFVNAEAPNAIAHVFHVDRVRRLLGILCLGSAVSCSCEFFIDGISCAPVFSRVFPFVFLEQDASFVHIVWIPYPETFKTVEASRKEESVTLVYRKTSALCLEYSSLMAPAKPKRSLAQHFLAFLAKFSFIQKRYSGCWLLVDKDFKADDNAEHFYRWLMQNHPEQKIFFALDKNTPDWTRLEREGFKLIDIQSLKYFFAWVLCSWICSSVVAKYTQKPAWAGCYSDIIKHQFCFLRHGVSKDYMFELNRHNIDLLVVSTHGEYHSFAEDPQYIYKFSPRDVQLTGNARHDALLRKAQVINSPKVILIMPTWRKNLAGSRLPNSGKYPYAPEFIHSDFFHNWQEVLQSPILHEAAKKHGYSIHFFLHPYFRQQQKDFNLQNILVSPDTGSSIQDLLVDTALLISDYSSIAMEAALLRRPVLYFQFDRKTFYTGEHTYAQGYFDYDRDGLGDVTFTAGELCTMAAESMANGCKMSEKYRKRADNFFAFNDQNHCKRIYDAICKLSGPAVS